VELNRAESWHIWRLMEITDWRIAPNHLLDTPDWLIEDLLSISSRASQIREMLKGSGK